jgi:hypothetical protein
MEPIEPGSWPPGAPAATGAVGTRALLPAMGAAAGDTPTAAAPLPAAACATDPVMVGTPPARLDGWLGLASAPQPTQMINRIASSPRRITAPLFLAVRPWPCCASSNPAGDEESSVIHRLAPVTIWGPLTCHLPVRCTRLDACSWAALPLSAAKTRGQFRVGALHDSSPDTEAVPMRLAAMGAAIGCGVCDAPTPTCCSTARRYDSKRSRNTCPEKLTVADFDAGAMRVRTRQNMTMP